MELLKQIAQILTENGGNVSFELNKRCVKEGVIIVYGASDDLTEFNGAIDDEKGHDVGGKIYLTKEGDIINNDYIEEDKYVQTEIDNCQNVINAVWCKVIDGKRISWTFETDIPHETFIIMEDNEIYCIGIVFLLSSLK